MSSSLLRRILNVFLLTQDFSVQRNTLVVTPQKPTLVLQRKEEGSAKSLNETLLSRLRPYRSATSAASLVALGASEPSGARKDDCKLTQNLQQILIIFFTIPDAVP